MAFLLTTKLNLPKPSAVYVNRPRLNQLLEDGRQCHLTLINAPAGYGKTSLVSSWLNQQHGSDVAWLSLDEFDDDPVRFLRYFVAAWQTIDPNLGKAASETLEGNTTGLLQAAPQSLLIPLINDLARRIQPSLLVLDDFHLITSQSIQKLLNFWIENAPSQTRIIMTTRHEPDLSLSRWRVRGQLAEISAVDLQFTAAETVSFLRDRLQLPVTDEDVAQLMSKTEGWAASLQLIALSLQGQSDPETVLAKFSGTHRYVVDYLVDEVLARESAELQEFLRHTSILTRLTPSLCDALTGRKNSQQLLLTLDRRNLFINATDQSGSNFRYHPLFAETLRKQLEESSPEKIGLLHERAFSWFSDQKNIEAAVMHGILAKQFEDVAKILNEYADAAVWKHNQASQVVRWCKNIPLDILQKYPRLMLDYGWGMLMGGARDQIEAYCSKIAPFISELGNETLQIEFDTLQTEGSILQNDLNDALTKLNSIDYEGLRAASSYAVIRQVQGYINRLDGNIEIAEEALLDAREICREADNLVLWLGATGDLADAYRIAGRLNDADATFNEMRQRIPTNQHLIYGSIQFAKINHSWVYLRRYRLAEALDLAQQGLINAQTNGMGTTFGRFALWVMAYIRQAQGESAQALELIDEAIRGLQKSKNQRLKEIFSAHEANLHLLQGNSEKADQWAKTFKLERPSYITRYLHQEMSVIYGRWLLTKNIEDGLELLAKCQNTAELNSWGDSLLQCLVLQAVGYQQLGKIDSALKFVENAVTIAAQEGYIEPFVTAGRPMVELLRLQLQRGGDKEQIGRIQAAFLPSDPVQPLIDPLTKRELEILRLMSAGLSNPEIANKLIIATGTVARHTNNIFSKLDVRNRTEATLKGRSLSLI